MTDEFKEEVRRAVIISFEAISKQFVPRLVELFKEHNDMHKFKADLDDLADLLGIGKYRLDCRDPDAECPISDICHTHKNKEIVS